MPRCIVTFRSAPKGSPEPSFHDVTHQCGLASDHAGPHRCGCGMWWDGSGWGYQEDTDA